MNLAIHLDHQLQFLAVEVEDETVQGKLATELLVQDLAIPQGLPEDHLRGSGSLPHLASPDPHVDQSLELTDGANLSLPQAASFLRLFLASSQISPRRESFPCRRRRGGRGAVIFADLTGNRDWPHEEVAAKSTSPPAPLPSPARPSPGEGR